MNLNRTFLTVCCVSVIFAACKKDDNNNGTNNSGNNNSSATQKSLVAGKWQQSAGTATVTYKGKDTTLDVYKEMDDCDKDDFILFADNGTGTIDENANKCSDDLQVENFKWALLNNDTRLALVDSNPDTFDVVTMTGTEMKLKLVKPNSSGQPVTTINTYKNIR